MSDANMLRRLALRLRRDEEGMLSMLSLFVILGCTVLLAFGLNVALAVRTKLEAQNAADGVAQAAGTEMARGLNAVTAANHLIGEVQAIMVLHHALGGDALERGGGDQIPGSVRNSFDDRWNLAQMWCAGVPAALAPQRFMYKEIGKASYAGASIGDSRTHLQIVTANSYTIHACGGFYYTYAGSLPFIGPGMRAFGVNLMATALTFETKATLEAFILDSFEMTARVPMQPIKAALRDAGLPALQSYAKAQVLQRPFRAEKAAAAIGNEHLAEGTLSPD